MCMVFIELFLKVRKLTTSDNMGSVSHSGEGNGLPANGNTQVVSNTLSAPHDVTNIDEISAGIVVATQQFIGPGTGGGGGYPPDGTTITLNGSTQLQVNLGNVNTWTGTQAFVASTFQQIAIQTLYSEYIYIPASVIIGTNQPGGTEGLFLIYATLAGTTGINVLLTAQTPANNVDNATQITIRTVADPNSGNPSGVLSIGDGVSNPKTIYTQNNILDDGLGNTITAGYNQFSGLKTTTPGDSGNAYWYMPEQGTSYKKVAIYLDAFVAATGIDLTYPTAFTNIPYMYGDTAAIAVGVQITTKLTITTAAPITGWIFLEGF